MTKTDEDTTYRPAEKVQPLKDLFHLSQFAHFYRLYVPPAILIGFVCGLLMVAFQLLIDSMILIMSPFPIYVTPIIGGLLSGFLIYVGRHEIQGSGISKAIELIHKPGSLRTATPITKILATSVSIGSGNPVGREGPAVLIGASVGDTIGRKLGFRQDSHLRVFLMMGSAACTAGIYRAPLGGSLFATEAPYKRDARLGYFVPTVIAALVSFITFSGLYPLISGNGAAPLFTFQAVFQYTLSTIPFLIFFGIIAGLISILFAVSLMATRNFFTLRLPDWADPVFGSALACIVIFLAWVYVGNPLLTIAGMGYNVINYLAANPQPLTTLLVLLFCKMLASSFVVAGRVSGGVLASSLFVGAMLGAAFGDLFFPDNVLAFTVMGMGAVLAANTNTPVATTVMMLEMSHSFDLVIPLVICISVSYMVGMGTSLYEGQKISRDDEDPDFYALVSTPKDGRLRIAEIDATTEVSDEDAELP